MPDTLQQEDLTINEIGDVRIMNGMGISLNMTPQKRNNTFHVYCCRLHVAVKDVSVQCCHRNSTMGLLCTVADLKKYFVPLSTLSELCIVIHIREKDQQDAHFS